MAELDAALAAITGDSGASSFDADDVRGPRAVFLIARAEDGTPLGCGALRPLEGDVGEIKRMYARAGSGAGAPLLAALEAHAARLGYAEVRLSTRRINTRAVDFYRRHGYAEAPAWGKYADNPVSVCLGKPLF
ncbi:GNAT family N-acetyltransferase [uncultured Massilia sp.]|uniref:GNAT family N-acetyltransferase n=1 Tax=uncultured Massilia sp. TaxID=169973 RepID=UPI00258BCAF6|nr:GNAT family N-acetyltransferase [uncultured Massilia sp.]